MSTLETLGAALLLAAGVAAAVSAVTVRTVLERVPRTGSVRLSELVADYMEKTAREHGDQDEAAEAARGWAKRLDEALVRTSARHRAVLLPARAVAAGAADFTAEVEAAMRAMAREDDLRARGGGETMRRSNVLEGRPRGNRILFWAASAALVWLALASRVYVNASWSDGAWGYVLLPLVGAPGRGDAVVFDPPAAVGSPVPYLKTVRGLPGDRVDVDGKRRVRVNGRVLGVAKTHALDGRPLRMARPGVIPPGRYYVHADHVDSHDSRYTEIGLVERDRIRGRALALPDIPWLGLEGPLASPEDVRP